MVDIIPISLGFVNCYLLKNGGDAILVDTGVKGSERKIVAELSRHGVEPGNLRMILLTHGHTDHVGGCAALRETYGVKVGVHPKDETVTKPLQGDTFLSALTLPFMNAAKPITVTPDVPLTEGVDLGEYGVPAKLLALPGHTDGSVALLFDDGRLVAGDTFFNHGKPTLAHIAVDFNALYKVRGRLDSLGITTVYPGHGKPFPYSELAR